MKTKTIIEWVSGESPETESLKLISITEGDGRKRTSIGFMLDGTWFEDGGILPLADEGGVVTAWAPLPVFDGEVEPLHEQEGKTIDEVIPAILSGRAARRFGWPLGMAVRIPDADMVAKDWVILD